MNDTSKDMRGLKLSIVVSEVKLAYSNPRELWVDTGSTKNICFNRGMFITFEGVENGENIFMVNSTVLEVKGK